MKFTPILASDFGGIGLAGIYSTLLLIASIAATIALTLAAIPRTRRSSVWVSSLALVAGLLLFAFYLFSLREVHPHWIIIPLSVLPGAVAAFAHWLGMRVSR